jgi:hypothetical protein
MVDLIGSGTFCVCFLILSLTEHVTRLYQPPFNCWSVVRLSLLVLWPQPILPAPDDR